MGLVKRENTQKTANIFEKPLFWEKIGPGGGGGGVVDPLFRNGNMSSNTLAVTQATGGQLLVITAISEGGICDLMVFRRPQ